MVFIKAQGWLQPDAVLILLYIAGVSMATASICHSFGHDINIVAALPPWFCINNSSLSKMRVLVTGILRSMPLKHLHIPAPKCQHHLGPTSWILTLWGTLAKSYKAKKHPKGPRAGLQCICALGLTPHWGCCPEAGPIYWYLRRWAEADGKGHT